MLTHELIPARDPKSKRLMIMLHGLGDTMEGYRWLPKVLDIPWLNVMLVDAPDPYLDGYSWFNYPDDLGPGVLRSRRMLFEFLDYLRGQNFPTEEITLAGFSQGCLMTVDVGLRYPHRFAGLLGISGWVFELETLAKEHSAVWKEQRLMLTHGQFDPVIPFNLVKDQAAKLSALGVNIQWREFPKAHTIYGTEEIDAIREFVRAGYPEAK